MAKDKLHKPAPVDELVRAFAKEHERATCPKRSQVCGQPMPCRQSATRPGTCLWCLCRITASGQIPEPPPAPRVEHVRRLLIGDRAPLHTFGDSGCPECGMRHSVDADHAIWCSRRPPDPPPSDDVAPIHPSDLRGLRFRQ